MIQDGLRRKDKDLAKMKKHIIELLDQAWTKGYIAGCDDGYKTGRMAGPYLDSEVINHDN